MSIEHCDKHEIFWLSSDHRQCPICSKDEPKWVSTRCALAAVRWWKMNYPFHTSKALEESLFVAVKTSGTRENEEADL